MTSTGWGRLCVENTLRLLQAYNNNNIPTVTAMQTNGDTVEDAIYSNEYVDLVLSYDSSVERIMNETNFISSCRILENQFAIIQVRSIYLDYLRNILGRNSIGLEPFLLGLMESTALDASGITTVQNQPYLSLRGSGVLIGVIDTGIDYRNSSFIYEDGSSKIVSIWDQSIRSVSPNNFCYGTEYTNEDINRALQSDNPLEIVPSVDEVGHGTNIASIAAGRENTQQGFIGAAPDSQLIVVKLKPAKQNLREANFVSDSVNCYASSDVMNGIDYVLNKAEEMNMPVSIILGIGTNEGGHTGESIFERYISTVSTRNGVCITCGTGNEADKQHHAYMELTANNAEKEFEIRVDENENGFPLYIWSYVSDKISVSITSPLGEVVERIYPSLDFNHEYNLVLGNTRVSVSYFLPVYQSSDQLTLIKFTTPTPGIWRIRIYGDIILIGLIHAWLPISEFLQEGTVFLAPNSLTTLTVPSSARILNTTGTYNQIDGSLYAPSGRGPTRLSGIRPYYVAPGVRVEALGTNGITYFTGSSAAAAVTGGAAALLLEWGYVRGNINAMNTITITNYLIRGTTRFQNEVYPNNLWGFGAINVYNSIQSI